MHSVEELIQSVEWRVKTQGVGGGGGCKFLWMSYGVEEDVIHPEEEVIHPEEEVTTLL